MGRGTFTRSAFDTARSTFVPRTGPATRAAEQSAKRTGKLNPLVDPKEYDVIRRSLVRFEEREDGLLELTIGCSMPIETRLDTTGSMGGNVDVALRVLPDLYDLCSWALPGYDVHVAIGIFGDVVDSFVLCRPQFEMEADKIVEQLTLMVPDRWGGDSPEDPQYGLFGAAYLTRAYANQIGLKRYDFTVSDATAHDGFSERQLIRIFGDEVFDKVAFNGYQINRNNLPTNEEVVRDLLTQAHAFFLQVGRDSHVTDYWAEIFGPERVVQVPDVRLLPNVQSLIIALTEGTAKVGGDNEYDFPGVESFTLSDAEEFLIQDGNISIEDARHIVRAVANIPIGAQVPLRQAIIDGGHEIPKAGDLFRVKPDVFAGTDLWPIDPSELGDIEPVVDTDSVADGPNWL
jgi:hypothetical protein